ncbi:MYCB2 ligase, partial [Polypterus senegalus]
MSACPGPGAPSDCRGRYQLLLSGTALAENYRRIYTAAISDKEQGINQGSVRLVISAGDSSTAADKIERGIILRFNIMSSRHRQT